jgi:hypothetical protein
MKTCTHLHDTGEPGNSAAAINRDYCVFHLRYRARQHRMAQSRARSDRFDLKLPPLESMSTVLSALNQIVEAIAADMIDLERADLLLKSLRFAAQALKSSDNWRPSVYHTDVAAPAINLESEYGLPQDLNLDTPPGIAFPPVHDLDLSSSGAPPLSPDFGDRVGATDKRQLTTWTSVPTRPSLPSLWNSATSPRRKVTPPPPFASGSCSATVRTANRAAIASATLTSPCAST